MNWKEGKFFFLILAPSRVNSVIAGRKEEGEGEIVAIETSLLR